MLLAVLLAILVITAGGWAIHSSKKQKAAPNSTDKPYTISSGGSKVDLSPATSQDQQYSDSRKDQITDTKPSDSTSPPSTSGSVTPLITYAEQSDSTVDVSAYIPGIVEDGGSCTLTATLDNTKVTQTNPAFMNAKTTNCKNFSVPVSEFSSSGIWNLKISYSSSSHTGTSAETTVTIKK